MTSVAWIQSHLRGLDTLDFPPFLQREKIFVTPIAFLYTESLAKKEFTPLRSNSFPLHFDSNHQDSTNILTKLPTLSIHSL